MIIQRNRSVKDRKHFFRTTCFTLLLNGIFVITSFVYRFETSSDCKPTKLFALVSAILLAAEYAVQGTFIVCEVMPCGIDVESMQSTYCKWNDFSLNIVESFQCILHAALSASGYAVLAIADYPCDNFGFVLSAFLTVYASLRFLHIFRDALWHLLDCFLVCCVEPLCRCVPDLCRRCSHRCCPLPEDDVA